jgi:hypothetical protein
MGRNTNHDRHLLLVVIIHNLNLIRSPICLDETNPILVNDANALLTFLIT